MYIYVITVDLYQIYSDLGLQERIIYTKTDFNYTKIDTIWINTQKMEVNMYPSVNDVSVIFSVKIFNKIVS